MLQYELDMPLHKLKKTIGEHNATRAYQLCGDAIDKLINIINEVNHKESYRRKSLFFSTHQRQKKASGESPETLVRDLMTPAVFSVRPDDSARQVVEQMIGLNVHQIYVVDREGILVGVISAFDVVRHLAE